MTITDGPRAPEQTDRQRALAHMVGTSIAIHDLGLWLAQNWPTDLPLPKVTTKVMTLAESTPLGLRGIQDRVTYQACVGWRREFERLVGVMRRDGIAVEVFEVEGYAHARRFFGPIALEVAGPLAVW